MFFRNYIKLKTFNFSQRLICRETFFFENLPKTYFNILIISLNYTFIFYCRKCSLWSNLWFPIKHIFNQNSILAVNRFFMYETVKRDVKPSCKLSNKKTRQLLIKEHMYKAVKVTSTFIAIANIRFDDFKMQFTCLPFNQFHPFSKTSTCQIAFSFHLKIIIHSTA